VFKIEFSINAEKQFYKLPKEVQTRIAGVLERIKTRPEAYVKRLVGLPYYRLRVGEYRLILDIQRNKLSILIIKIGKREDIYEF